MKNKTLNKQKFKLTENRLLKLWKHITAYTYTLIFIYSSSEMIHRLELDYDFDQISTCFPLNIIIYFKNDF